jgi:hypothetical protein
LQITGCRGRIDRKIRETHSGGMTRRTPENPLGAQDPKKVTLGDVLKALPHKNLPHLELKGESPAHLDLGTPPEIRWNYDKPQPGD